MKRQIYLVIGLALLVGLAAACAPAPTPVPPTQVPPTAVPATQVPPTVAPTVAPTKVPTAVATAPVPTKAPTAAATAMAATKAPTVAATSAATHAATSAATRPATTTAADLFAYCATAGNLDAPDARWTGPKVPDAVITGLIKALKLPANTATAPLVASTVWRCMNYKVYACTVGANLPCSEKADLSKTPSAATADYCKSNPTSDFIPAYITGRATVYDWKCVQGTATVSKQLVQADARGFIADYWYEITK